MVVFPNAKINLGLNILRRRSDGYHDISSCFYPIAYSDILEVVPADKLTFESSGLAIPGNGDENLCLKAYKLLKADFDLQPVSIHLHKIIPIGAGLGGGSSDASFTLKCINELFDLNLSQIELEQYAGKLGSDCPFFIQNKPRIAEGTGHELSPLALNLEGYFILLVYPEIHVSTAEAYSNVMPEIPVVNINDIISQPVDHWVDLLKNDFEKSVFKKYPQIEAIKNSLYGLGADYAAMSGSGSSVFGVFKEPPQKDLLSIFNGFSVWSSQL